MNKKIIAPIAVIVGMTALSVGTTYAIFSSKASSEIDLTAGRVQVTMTSTLDWAESRYEDEPPFDAVAAAAGTEMDAIFENMGTAVIDDESASSVLTLDRLAPMDAVGVKLSAINTSNISVKWRYVVEMQGELIPALEIYLNEELVPTGTEKVYGLWSDVVLPPTSEEEAELFAADLEIYFPDGDKEGYNPLDPIGPDGDTNDNIYQNKQGVIKVSVEMVQGNAKVENPHVPTKAYGFTDSYEEDGHWVHVISNADEFRNIMDSTVHGTAEEGKTGQFGYPGAGEEATVYLISDSIDFGGAIYNAAEIEEVKARTFTGTLRGADGVVLSNVHLTQIMGSATTTNYSMWGLFDSVLNATFENFTIADFSIANTAGKVCGFIAAGQENKNKFGDEGFDSAAYLTVKNVTVNNDCFINVSGNAGSLFGNARNIDTITIMNCENNADITVSGGNAGGFIGSASFNQLSDAKVQFDTLDMYVENCTNNGKITTGSSGYLSSFCGYNLHNVTVKNYTNNGVIEIVGHKNTNVGVFSGQFPGVNQLDVSYENVVQNSYIKYTGATKPIHSDENKHENMQVYYVNGEGDLVSGFDGSGVTVEYKNTKILASTVQTLSLSFDEDGTLKVADNSLVNLAKITVRLTIGGHTAEADGVCYNDKSTPNNLVHYEEIASISGTTEELNARGLKKVNQIGYFAREGVTPTFPEDSWGRITRYVNNFLLDGSLYGQEGYTDADLGYGINSKGGYVLVRSITDTGFKVITPLHQDPHFTINAYDGEGNLVAVGELYSGRIVGEHVPEDIHVTAGIDKYVYLG